MFIMELKRTLRSLKRRNCGYAIVGKEKSKTSGEILKIIIRKSSLIAELN